MFQCLSVSLQRFNSALLHDDTRDRRRSGPIVTPALILTFFALVLTLGNYTPKGIKIIILNNNNETWKCSWFCHHDTVLANVFTRIIWWATNGCRASDHRHCVMRFINVLLTYLLTTDLTVSAPVGCCRLYPPSPVSITRRESWPAIPRREEDWMSRVNIYLSL